MARLVALLALSCACDAGPPAPPPPRPPTPQRHIVPRASLLTHDLHVELPANGIVVETAGMGDATWDVVDFDKRVLKVRIEAHATVREQVISLERDTLANLSVLSDRAWRETPHGDMPKALDIEQALYLTSDNDAFYLRGEPIGDVTGHTGRPDASALVLAIQKLADPALEPPPSRHPHAIPRSALGLPDLDLPNKELPKHGVILKAWGLAGDSTLVVDRDAGTVREITNMMRDGHKDRTRKLAPAKLEAVMAAANAAWGETQNGDMPDATDVREDLYVFDDDEAFYLSGHPIGAYGKQGRPLAQVALEALFALER